MVYNYMTTDLIEKIQVDGYVILPDFLSSNDIQELKDAIRTVITNFDRNSQEKCIFTTSGNTQHTRDTYFARSADKISPFYEEGALDSLGQLQVPIYTAFNKIGHALHWLNPVFRKHTFSDKVKHVIQSLGFKAPIVPQSMYIFKNAGIGGEVTPHQDGTYLHTSPLTVCGFWLALDDATVENGCLWFIPGSHKRSDEVDRLFIKNPVEGSTELFIYDSPAVEYDQKEFVAVPVKKGSCILIDAKVVHQSAKNTSPHPRHAYTFHIVESHMTTWSPQNWLQPTEAYSFPFLNDK